jgi:hypothetical protein
MYGKSSIKLPHFFVPDTTKFMNSNTSSARIHVSDSGSFEPQVVTKLIFRTTSSVYAITQTVKIKVVFN